MQFSRSFRRKSQSPGIVSIKQAIGHVIRLSFLPKTEGEAGRLSSRGWVDVRKTTPVQFSHPSVPRVFFHPLFAIADHWQPVDEGIAWKKKLPSKMAVVGFLLFFFAFFVPSSPSSELLRDRPFHLSLHLIPLFPNRRIARRTSERRKQLIAGYYFSRWFLSFLTSLVEFVSALEASFKGALLWRSVSRFVSQTSA